MGGRMVDLFFCTFIVYIMYFFVSVNKYDKNGHIKKSSLSVKTPNNMKKEDFARLPSETKYFIKKYNIDLDKVNLRGLLKMNGYVLGLDIGLVFLIVSGISSNIYIITAISVILIIPVYLLSLKILAKNFKKRGLIKNV